MIQCTCPSCGAAVRFKSELSVYATCGSCDALLVRHDVDVEQIGQVAELQPDGSPIQVGTQGSYQGRQFEVVGRIQITYGDGYWNEWHLLYESGESGWLGEAAGEYFLSRQSQVSGLPAFPQLSSGQVLDLEGEQFAVTNLMTSRVVSFEGELPFIMSTEYELPAADLRSLSGKAATIDYSGGEPLLFVGEYLPFSDLSFKNLREIGDEADDMVDPSLGWQAVRKVNCTSCGAPLELKGGPRTRTLVCEYCDSALDATDPNLSLIWKAKDQRRHKVPPSVPLGSVATFDEVEWECIGYLRRSVTYEGVIYPWSEYLLYNRFHGYRWLNESNGHFSLMEGIQKLPGQGSTPVARPTQADITWEGQDFKHFQSAQARVDYLAGEFYWRVRVGDPAVNHDFVHPPELLSMEATDRGVVWSRGLYLTGQEVWRAFGLEGRPPLTAGVAPNQPNPYQEDRVATWRLSKILVALAFLLCFVHCGASMTRKNSFTKNFQYMDYAKSRVEVTEPFQLKGRTSNVKVEVESQLSNRWAFYNLALVNEKTKKAFNFGIENYRYSGDDKRRKSVTLPSVPSGTYYLTWNVESGTTGPAEKTKPPPPGRAPRPVFSYRVSVKRDVPMWGWFWLLMIALLIPPMMTTVRYNGIETRRWSESDHAGGTWD